MGSRGNLLDFFANNIWYFLFEDESSGLRGPDGFRKQTRAVFIFEDEKLAGFFLGNKEVVSFFCVCIF